MQLYSNPFTQTVDPRHVRGRAIGSLIVGVEPGADDTRIGRTRSGRTCIVPAGVDQRRLRMPWKVGRDGRCEMGDVVGTSVRLGNSVLASRTRPWGGCKDSLAGRQIALKHGVEESDRTGENSTTMRGTVPERGLALQFNRFRNPYGAERTERKRS